MTMETRFQIRKRVLAERDNLDLKTRTNKSEQIRKKLLLLEQIQKSRVVFCYVNFRSEVKTKQLISDLLNRGIMVAVPLTLEAEKKLLPVIISDVEKDLEPGYCTILEPKKELVTQSCVDPGKIDTIILPGSVFDVSGGRMGYGGGFYDRFIAYQAPRAQCVGICYDLQLVEKLILEPHDQEMGCIVTESKLIQGL